ncbi:MAG: Rho termination factor N-terminal domain-containing protein, partial [Flavobacterium sp.]|nr:Rho termination factor N-terminal domain-containing protein [Flavobacterium sp.]
SKEKSARIANSKGAEKRGGHAKKYEDQSKKEIYAEAKKVGIEGRSKMTKGELIKALRTN